MNFDIKTEQISDDAYVISLAGEVDLYTAPEFKQQLLEVIGQGGKHVIVDFTSTTFIDSTTLGVLVGGVKRLRTNDGQLSLVCSDRNITKIFEITGLDRVFAIHATRDEAVSKLDGVSQPSVVALRHVLAITSVASLVALAAAGCGAVGRVGQGDLAHGKQLFLATTSKGSCASCHTLADAKSTGTLGPNLDDAFSSDKAQGFSEQTMADIVRGQIAYPEEPMPANLYRGQDARDIALYVAKCSGQPELRRDRRDDGAAHDDREDVDDDRVEARRQGSVRLGRLRRVPHAEGRRLERQRRPEPRPAEAVEGDGRAPGRSRRRHHARVQGAAESRGDRCGR